MSSGVTVPTEPVGKIMRGLRSLDLDTEVILLVAPADSSCNPKCAYPFLSLVKFHQESAIPLQKHNPAVAVGETRSGKVTHDRFVGGELVHSAVGMVRPIGVVFLVALPACFWTYVVFVADVAVPIFGWNQRLRRFFRRDFLGLNPTVDAQ